MFLDWNFLFRDMPFTRIAVALVSLLALAPAIANPFSDWLRDFSSAGVSGKSIYAIDIDNDTLLLDNRDGLYTSGLRYSLTRFTDGRGSVTLLGWRIGQELYTPTRTSLPPRLVGPPDRPYAGWIYTGGFRENATSDGARTRIGIDIGCLGPCAGGDWTQTNFHRLIDEPLPRGWSKQVRNEPGIVIYGEHAPKRWVLLPWLDLTPTISGRVGNIFTDAGIAVSTRAGRLNLLPHQSTWHGFLRLDAKAVVYNGTLQGGLFSDVDPHKVKPKRVVGEAQVGMTWKAEPFSVMLSVVRRSNEVRDLSNSVGAQNYARLVFSYTN